MSDILAIIEPFVDKALKMGADEVEFFAQKIRNKNVNFEHNNMKSALASIIDGIGIRVLKNKALGFASSNSLDKIKIEDSLKEALAIAKVTPPEDNYYLSAKQKITKVPEMYDKAIESFSMDDTITYSKNLLEKTIEHDSRVTVDSGTFSSVISDSALANSNGVNISETKSIFSWALLGMAVDGKDIGSFDYCFDSVAKVSDIDIEITANDFAKKVLRNLNAQKTESFEGPCVGLSNSLTRDRDRGCCRQTTPPKPAQPPVKDHNHEQEVPLHHPHRRSARRWTHLRRHRRQRLRHDRPDGDPGRGSGRDRRRGRSAGSHRPGRDRYARDRH